MNTFSDSESTGSESGVVEGGGGSGVEGGDTDSITDETWLRDMMAQVDAHLVLSAPAPIYSKWKAICSLTLLYHRTLRDTQREQEQEQRQLHDARTALASVTQEHEALSTLFASLQQMMDEEMSKWEMVSSDDEAEGQGVKAI